MKANLITRPGYKQLEKELDYLWRDYRPKITEKVAWAASLGDRSDNADYKENKRLLRQIDSKIRYLRKRLDTVRIVDYSPKQEGKVYFGAWVKVENGNSEKKEFRIVGPDEIYNKASTISINSPMGRALVGKSVGDEVTVVTPKHENKWSM
ncbi:MULTISPECIES: transcription elongation factor GreB [Idiomarina]|jgi:transcription elongation factor GreB|uniref:transcription elongation factor GreB n=1 Tax=Idiomarina TaxID=135575 RepID=UPI000C0AA11B|nr:MULTISPECIES: transcription elongation factor GreB [Idiomarina]MAC35034.1 transcription elongation factor GreB [Haliea sp.]MAO67832.1 transcription elongation factor GreB [Idiomarina sp.]MBF79572.1 transcription elongation factor GreB [Idiomarina sp.]|tara:strand:+ start:118 stop:570 length:453 start_codon:yes stop_codon:yes gene_type:complete